MKRKIITLLGFMAGWVLCAQNTITIDASKTYQTIEGLGGFCEFAAGTTAYTTDYFKQIIDNLGCTAFRQETPTNFVTSLANLNSSTFNNGAGTLAASNVEFGQKIKAKGQQLVISTTWSPPFFMKQSQCTSQKVPATVGGTPICGQACVQPVCAYNYPDSTNYLLASSYADYAKFLDYYAKDYKAKTGFDLYALGIQNEPMFNEPYNSGIMYAPEFGACLKVVGARFAADPALQNIKFYGGEHMCTYSGNSGGTTGMWGGTNASKYVQYLLDDATVRPYTHAFAVHGYVDGISLDIGSAADYTAFASKTDSYSKKMWMTETGFSDNGWTGYMTSAKGLFLALKYGHVSLWTYWVLRDNLYTSMLPDGRTAVTKQFFRFIRPGAQQIDAVDATTGLISMAFKKGSDITIMILNDGTTAQTLTINGAGGTTIPSSMQIYRTSATEYCGYLGKTTSNTITVPASSITTLYYNATTPDAQYAPNSPQGLTVQNLAETSGRLAWTAPADWTMNALPSNYTIKTNGYYVYRKEANGTWTKLSGMAQTGLTYNITGLKAGYQYTYAVIARDELYNLSARAEITFRTPCTTSCPDTTGIGLDPIADPSVAVYPNPTTGIIAVSGVAGNTAVVYDINGIAVLSQACTRDEEQLDLSGLADGLYIIKVIKSDAVIVKEVILKK